VLSTLKTIGAALGILLVGVGAAVGMMATSKKPERSAIQDKAPLVTIMVAQSSDEKIVVGASGTVVAAREVSITPQVSGTVLEISADLVPGSVVRVGEILARIDDRDYRDILMQRTAQLEDARYALAVEEGSQEVARQEWALMDGAEVGEANRKLMLREPHLARARANVASAESSVAMARRDIERTVVRAPFDALLIARGVEAGQVVSQQSLVAKLVATDAYWVRVNVPASILDSVHLPDAEGEGGALVSITHDLGRGSAVRRTGKIIRLLGSVEAQGKMAQLLVEIANPLKGPDSPLLLGAYVLAEIDGNTLTDVVVIPRKALREGGKVWVMDKEDRLDVRRVEVAWRRADEVIVTSGIAPGERVITSHLASPVDGIAVRTRQQ